jgi:hypothetical protein
MIFSESRFPPFGIMLAGVIASMREAPLIPTFSP